MTRPATAAESDCAAPGGAQMADSQAGIQLGKLGETDDAVDEITGVERGDPDVVDAAVGIRELNAGVQPVKIVVTQTLCPPSEPFLAT